MQLYLLLGLRTEGSLIITLMDVKSHKVSNICLNAEELVKELKGSLTKMIPTASELTDRYRKELLEPVRYYQFRSEWAFEVISCLSLSLPIKFKLIERIQKGLTYIFEIKI